MIRNEMRQKNDRDESNKGKISVGGEAEGGKERRKQARKEEEKKNK